MVVETFLLFLLIVLSTTFLMVRAQRIRSDGSIKFNYGYFILSFLIHWFFIAFTKTGVDHQQYIKIILYDSDFFFEKGIEVGINGLFILLRRLTGNAEIVIFFVKTITLVIYYLAFWHLRNCTKLGFVIAAYNAKLYSWSYIIIGQTFAVGLIILATSFIINQKKWYWPLLISLIAYTIHASALIMFVIFVAIILMNSFKMKSNSWFIYFLLIVVIMAIQNIGLIFGAAMSNVESFEQYLAYEESENKGIGWFNYIFFSVLFMMYLYPIIHSTMKLSFKNLAMLLFFYGFVSALSGYYLGSYRLNYYTYSFYVCVIPYFFFVVDTNRIKCKGLFSVQISRVSWLLFLLFTTCNMLMDVSTISSAAMMANYKVFNPFGG